jgi:hypothetical protein
MLTSYMPRCRGVLKFLVYKRLDSMKFRSLRAKELFQFLYIDYLSHSFNYYFCRRHAKRIT